MVAGDTIIKKRLKIPGYIGFGQKLAYEDFVCRISKGCFGTIVQSTVGGYAEDVG
jgi:hypothetical protein